MTHQYLTQPKQWKMTANGGMMEKNFAVVGVFWVLWRPGGGFWEDGGFRSSAAAR